MSTTGKAIPCTQAYIAELEAAFACKISQHQDDRRRVARALTCHVVTTANLLYPSLIPGTQLRFTAEKLLRCAIAASSFGSDASPIVFARLIVVPVDHAFHAVLHKADATIEDRRVTLLDDVSIRAVGVRAFNVVWVLLEVLLCCLLSVPMATLVSL